MRNRFLLLWLLFAFAGTAAYAQDQTIEGRVLDNSTGKPVEKAIVKAYFKGASARTSARTNAQGYYKIVVNEPMVFDSLVAKEGSSGEAKITDKITVRRGDHLVLPNLRLALKGVIIVIEYKPVLNPQNTTPGSTTEGDAVRRTAAENANQIVKTTAGATQVGNGGISIKGARTNATQYIVDGIRMGSTAPNLSTSAIGEIAVITGGVPAEYGDLTGGVVNITTRGIAEKFFGSVEGRTSQFLDPFGYNYIQGNVVGPLAFKKDEEDTSRRRALLGFTAAGSFNAQEVSSPPAVNMFRVKDDVLAQIENDPLRKSPLGAGFVSNAYFVRKEDLTETRIKPNTSSMNYTFNGKLVFAPTKTMEVTVGGMVDHSDRNLYIYSFNMFNFKNNPQQIVNNTRGFVRLTQRFNTSDSDQSIIRNPSYSIQADYTRYDRVDQDRDLKDNFFAYGYLGSFERKWTPNYIYEVDTVDGKITQSNYLQGYSENGVTFTPSSYNPILARYTQRFFEESGDVRSFNDIQSNGGLLNGQSPQNVYSLWSGVGARYGSYLKQLQEQYFVNASGGFTIGKNFQTAHDIKIGVQYQQNINRSYQVGANNTNIQGLWTLGRQLLNSHLTQLDKSNPMPVYAPDGSFTDTVNYPYQFAADKQTAFDKNFRNDLIGKGARDGDGKLITESSIINIDRYSPEDLKLSYFSPDDLFNNGNGYVSYNGYDYLGRKLNGRTTLEDFLDPNKRYIGAYNPIYTAGYIQDRFKFKDMIFRVGLRVDRFDANQKVLKDPFSLYPIREASEVTMINNREITHPGNIGSDYAVYVDDAFNPTKVVGYRKDNRWYDATGAEVADPTIIAQSTNNGTIQPYLVARNKDEVKLTTESFTDYKPQVNVMPRVSFTFPISDNATFFANYDVLTMRPSTGNVATYDDYYFLQQRATFTIPNPNLKPERRVNYELGFNQKISSNSAINLQAYYGQIRDLVQRVQINQAYPITYTTFGNVDFGTVKGLTFGYNLFRFAQSADAPSGIELTANYTLQFAEGTGSNEGTAAALINAGQPNLRTPFPLDYDVRHQISGILDYRFGSGKEYSGPMVGGTRILENAGINFLFNARSGTPYSRQANVTVGEGVEIGVAGRSALAGTVNGSRLPWQFRVDMRVDKDFFFKTRKKDAEGKLLTDATGNVMRSRMSLNVFAMVQNLLDARNVVYVYRYTGLSDDDGYLNSVQGRQETKLAVDQQAFIDQYTVKMNNPDFYINPRFIRIGAMLNF